MATFLNMQATLPFHNIIRIFAHLNFKLKQNGNSSKWHPANR